MTERYFPMKSNVIDRNFSSFDWRGIFSNFFENGRTGLYNTLDESIRMSYSIINRNVLIISKGSLFIDGIMYINESVKEIEVPRHASSNQRVDIVVARIDIDNRLVLIELVASPVSTDLVLGTITVGPTGIVSVVNTNNPLKIKEGKYAVEKMKEYTYIIDSDGALADWVNGVAGYDYSKIFVKSGEYSMVLSSSITTPTTGYIYGSGSKIIFTSHEAIVNDSIIDNVSINGCKFENCKVSNGSFDKCSFKNCDGIQNISISEFISVTDVFNNCKNVNNIQIRYLTKQQQYTFFNECSNVSNIDIHLEVLNQQTMFTNCVGIHNVRITRSEGLPIGIVFSDCSNVNGLINDGQGTIIGCTHLYNCQTQGTYQNCKRMYNCSGSRATGCNVLYFCEMSTEYNNCYIKEDTVGSDNKFPTTSIPGNNTANIAQYGFNLGWVRL